MPDTIKLQRHVGKRGNSISLDLPFEDRSYESLKELAHKYWDGNVNILRFPGRGLPKLITLDSLRPIYGPSEIENYILTEHARISGTATLSLPENCLNDAHLKEMVHEYGNGDIDIMGSYSAESTEPKLITQDRIIYGEKEIEGYLLSVKLRVE